MDITADIMQWHIIKTVYDNLSLDYILKPEACACLDLHAGLDLAQNALACLCEPGHACLRLHALVCMGHGIVMYIRIHLNSTQASRLQDVVQC